MIPEHHYTPVPNVIAVERGDDICLLIEPDSSIPLERVGATISEGVIILFVRPGSPDAGWYLRGLPAEPVNRLLKQNSVIVAEVTQDNAFLRIVDIPLF